MVHKIGNFYAITISDSESIYMLAHTGSCEVGLINLSGGAILNDPIEVENLERITEEEWQRIKGGSERAIYITGERLRMLTEGIFNVLNLSEEIIV